MRIFIFFHTIKMDKLFSKQKKMFSVVKSLEKNVNSIQGIEEKNHNRFFF